MASIGRHLQFVFGVTLLAHVSGALQQLNCLSASAEEPGSKQGDGWHLILLMQGLAGTDADTQPSTVSLLAQDLCDTFADGDERIAVAVVEPNHSPNRRPTLMEQGKEAADEVIALVETNAKEGRHFADYSVIGHSLGGLVARVMAKLLATARSELAPRTYVSLFTPHVGLPDSVAKRLHARFTSSSDSNGLRELLELTGEGVLVQMASGEYRDVMQKFQSRVLYGATNDWLLDYESATLSASAAPEAPKAMGSSLGLNLRTVPSGAARCGETSPRSVVLCALSAVAFRRVALEWSLTRPGLMELKRMNQAERMELLRDLLPDLSGHSTLGRGTKCSSDSTPCSRGLQCLEGKCLPAYFSQDEICHASIASAKCGQTVEQVNAVTHQWHIVVTSSGGGGHIAAANNLREIISEQLQEKHAKAVTALSALRLFIQPADFKKLHNALLLVGDEAPHVQVMDIMKSNCMSIDGKGNLFMGDWMAEQWNEKQRSGDVEGMKQLIELQPITQVLLGKTCEEFLERYLSGDSLGFREPPVGLHSTQPLFVESLNKAAEKLNIKTVNIYTTDLPTPQCVHFFRPLKAFVKTGKAGRILLHTIMPRQGVAEAEKLSGLPPEQITIEPFMPIDPTFMRQEGLPVPGESTGILLKAQKPEEKQFLASLGNPLLVDSRDEVVLVMLGSQPTVSALRNYAYQFLQLPDPSRIARGKRYVYIGCGGADNEAYSAIYSELVAISHEANVNRSRTVLIPFTGQDAKVIFGRADVAITRSGGMTSGEILALRGRKGDDKRVFMHVEPVGQKVLDATQQMAKWGFHETVGKHDLSVWAMAALGTGMVPWEAGNARYLMDKVSAELVVPERLVETWTQASMFSKGSDAQMFAVHHRQACPQLWVGACERPEMEATPLQLDELAQGGAHCALALSLFRSAGRVLGTSGTNRVAQADVHFEAHRCGNKHILVGQKDSSPTPSYLTFGTSMDRAAQGAAAACGGQALACGEFVAVLVNATA